MLLTPKIWGTFRVIEITDYVSFCIFMVGRDQMGAYIIHTLCILWYINLKYKKAVEYNQQSITNCKLNNRIRQGRAASYIIFLR
jgi:hypothetical protein